MYGVVNNFFIRNMFLEGLTLILKSPENWNKKVFLKNVNATM